MTLLCAKCQKNVVTIADVILLLPSIYVVHWNRLRLWFSEAVNIRLRWLHTAIKRVLNFFKKLIKNKKSFYRIIAISRVWHFNFCDFNLGRVPRNIPYELTANNLWNSSTRMLFGIVSYLRITHLVSCEILQESLKETLRSLKGTQCWGSHLVLISCKKISLSKAGLIKAGVVKRSLAKTSLF